VPQQVANGLGRGWGSDFGAVGDVAGCFSGGAELPFDGYFDRFDRDAVQRCFAVNVVAVAGGQGQKPGFLKNPVSVG
jgi:hypothetical protein